MTDIRTDRTETAEGSRVAAYAQIDRRSAAPTSDPKVMAMVKGRPAGTPPVAPFAEIDRRKDG